MEDMEQHMEDTKNNQESLDSSTGACSLLLTPYPLPLVIMIMFNV